MSRFSGNPVAEHFLDRDNADEKLTLVLKVQKVAWSSQLSPFFFAFGMTVELKTRNQLSINYDL